jgi:hypothetical protein
LARVRRATAGWIHHGQDAGETGSDTNIVTDIGGRDLGSAWPRFEPRAENLLDDFVKRWPEHPAPDRAVAAVPGFVSPILMLLAALATLEGYLRLNVIPAGRWQPSAVVFAALAFLSVVALAIPRPYGCRMVAAKTVAVAATGLLAVTILARLLDRPPIAHLLGASDLVFAVIALGAVLANERAAQRKPLGRHAGSVFMRRED